jgi:hypothetical protein
MELDMRLQLHVMGITTQHCTTTQTAGQQKGAWCEHPFAGI